MRLALLIAAFTIFVVSCQARESGKTKLDQIRQIMVTEKIDAYIIPNNDEHISSYLSNFDKRCAWISGFKGSSGTGVVTKDKALLWTDSRYYIAAAEQLYLEWDLMKSSEIDTPSIEDWLKKNLAAGQVVGQFSKFSSISGWQSREKSLTSGGLVFKSPEKELIDQIWTTGRPSRVGGEIYVHDMAYAGKTWKQKVEDVKSKIKAAGANLLVLSSLDEIAWLFNLRGSDIPNNPFFFSYAIIDADNDAHRMYIDQTRITDSVRQHLAGIQFSDYDKITIELKQLSDAGKTIWVSPQSSYGIYEVVNKDKMVGDKASPVRSLKARKSDTELKNIRDCQTTTANKNKLILIEFKLRDSVYRIKHWYWLETELNKGTKITEKSSAAKLREIQATDKDFKMLSFGSISAVGANAAIVHYSTEEAEKEVDLTKDKIYLLDAGGNFLGCTTDITRTHHFGKPTQDEIDAYTMVLQGQTDLASIVFPQNVYGRELDVRARSFLWKKGMDYGHGTGHGIGYFLSVHEAPPNTAYSSRSAYDETFEGGMIQSDEPGYYVEDKFGIRLETDIETVEAKFADPYGGRKFYKFEPLTYVPFDANLIDNCALTSEQVEWLNEYNKKTQEKLVATGLLSNEEKAFLNRKTAPFRYSYQIKTCKNYYVGSASTKSLSFYLTAISTFVTMYFYAKF